MHEGFDAVYVNALIIGVNEQQAGRSTVREPASTLRHHFEQFVGRLESWVEVPVQLIASYVVTVLLRIPDGTYIFQGVIEQGGNWHARYHPCQR